MDDHLYCVFCFSTPSCESKKSVSDLLFIAKDYFEATRKIFREKKRGCCNEHFFFTRGGGKHNTHRKKRGVVVEITSLFFFFLGAGNTIHPQVSPLFFFPPLLLLLCVYNNRQHMELNTFLLFSPLKKIFSSLTTLIEG